MTQQSLILSNLWLSMNDLISSTFEKKKILVIGNGFLGSNLSTYLSEKNFEVGVVTRQKIKNNSDNSKVKFYQVGHQLFDPVDDFNPEVVINAAGSGSPSKYDLNPQMADLEVEFLTRQLINYWNQNNFNLIFFSSGGTVYGPNHSQPIRENSELNPISSYGKLKKIQENLFLENQAKNDKNLLILRISNVYHLGEQVRKAHGFIESCLTNLKENKPIKIYGTKEITRDFIYIKDFIEIVEQLIRIDLSGEIVNVGTGLGKTLRQIVELIRLESGNQIIVENIPSIEEKILYNVLDNSKLKSFINLELSSVESRLKQYFGNA